MCVSKREIEWKREIEKEREWKRKREGAWYTFVVNMVFYILCLPFYYVAFSCFSMNEIWSLLQQQMNSFDNMNVWCECMYVCVRDIKREREREREREGESEKERGWEREREGVMIYFCCKYGIL